LSGALEPVFIPRMVGDQTTESCSHRPSFPLVFLIAQVELVHDVGHVPQGWVGALEQIEQYFERAPFCVVRVFGFYISKRTSPGAG